MPETFADYVLLYLQVAPDEVGAIDAVSHDSAHESRGKNHVVGLFGVEKFTHRHSIEQVELGMRASHKVCITFLLEVFPDSRAYESAVSGNIYFSVFFHFSVC